MTMTAKQISEKLVAIHAALVEKLGAQPWADTAMRVETSGKCQIVIYGDFDTHSTDRIACATSDTFEGVLAEAERLIAALTDSETAAKRTFHKNLANVIDEGNSLNMPTEVMAPLGEGMKALSENLLTFDGEIAK